MGITILDGGMGQELVRRGLAAGELWSTQALVDAPDAVREVHTAYLDAGADVLTTNTYAVSRSRFEHAGAPMTVAQAVTTACRLAGEAIERDGDGHPGRRRIRLAGSLGPLRGSYAPERVPDDATLLAEYREIAWPMADHVDIVLGETLTTVREAVVVAQVAAEIGRPVWISWTVQISGPHRLADGTPLAEAVASVPAEVHLLNCSPPEVIDQALPRIAGAGGTIGAYANGFAEVPRGWSLVDGDPLPDARSDLDPDTYLAHARRWVEIGASLVGGCCEVGPEHIRRLAEALRDHPPGQ